MLSQKAHKLPLVSVDSVSASTMLGRSLVHAGQAVVGAPGPAKQAEETGAHTRTSPHRSVVVEYTTMLLTHCLPSLMDRTIVGAARVAKACPIRGHGVRQLLFHRSHAARTHGTPVVNSRASVQGKAVWLWRHDYLLELRVTQVVKVEDKGQLRHVARLSRHDAHSSTPRKE